MVKFFESINDDLRDWALKQSAFWTASAPLAGKHVNCSPKGVLQSAFSILGPNQVAYVDLTGSGAETISHLYENGRIVVMFNSFDSAPRILRFWCSGHVIEKTDPRFQPLLVKMSADRFSAVRAIILLDVWKVATSCGYGVPVLETTSGTDGQTTAFLKDRDTIIRWGDNKARQGKVDEYQAEWNARSLDGLTGLKTARKMRGEKWLWLGDIQAFARRVVSTQDVLLVGVLVGAMIGAMAMRIVPKLMA